jgi:serine/threonine-protein kinase RsbT
MAENAASADGEAPQPRLYPIVSDNDVVQFRHQVRAAAVAAGLRLVDQTKLVTAASELARNALEHGGGGLGEIGSPETAGRRGVRVILEDDGPGISDLDLALTDGFSRDSGMGMGLPGSRRLVDYFDLWSEVGVGTCVIVEKWAL